MLLDNQWILWAIPLLWGIVTILFLCMKNTAEKLPFHISASILIGLFVFLVYAWGGIYPFVLPSLSLGG
jgi:cytochrome bd-type quinol oxidase subunit 2